VAHHPQVVQRAASGLDTALTVELGAMAQQACLAAGATGCLICFRTSLERCCLWAAAGRLPQRIDKPEIAELISAWARRNGGVVPFAHYPGPSDRAVLRSSGIEVMDSNRLDVTQLRDGPAAVDLAFVAADPGANAGAIAALTARSILSHINQATLSQQVSFWREQAAELRDRLSAARAQATEHARAHRAQMAAERRMAAHAKRGNLRALASALSRLGPFESWIVAAQDNDGLRIQAQRVRRRTSLESMGRALQGFVAPDGGRTPRSTQNRMRRVIRQAGYRSFICVPLDRVRVLLLSRDSIPPAVRTAVMNCGAAIEPHVRNFFASRELERQRNLSRSLTRGLFAVSDAERSSFRRDLHDDWAQLLAAAQIAMHGNGRDAQRFFHELEAKLRARLQSLRPPHLPRMAFSRAIEAQIQRLSHAGIQANADIRGLNRVPQAIKEVLLRVVAEGVSNVILHAQADQVRIEVQRNNGVARVAVRDNGRGARQGKDSAGSGLHGLAERVALLGGRCGFHSRPGSSELTAEIPVAQL
jgi:signal transduction histidine kinase